MAPTFSWHPADIDDRTDGPAGTRAGTAIPPDDLPVKERLHMLIDQAMAGEKYDLAERLVRQLKEQDKAGDSDV